MEPKTLFLVACIPARILIASLPKILTETQLRYFGLILLLIGFTFHGLFWTNSRLEAPEGGGTTWWNGLRPVHGTLYLLAGALAVHGDVRAWIPLAVDVVIGLAAHVQRYHS